jgi:hypothetical protein
MKNAQLRMGPLEFERYTEKIATRNPGAGGPLHR